MPHKIDPEILLLDLRGYRCPVPVLKLEAALRDQPHREQIRVWTDDPIAKVDIPHFGRQAGYAVTLLAENSAFCDFLVTPILENKD